MKYTTPSKQASLSQAPKTLRLVWMMMASYFWDTKLLRWTMRANSSGAKITQTQLVLGEWEQKPRRIGRFFMCNVEQSLFFLWKCLTAFMNGKVCLKLKKVKKTRCISVSYSKNHLIQPRYKKEHRCTHNTTRLEPDRLQVGEDHTRCHSWE